MIARLLHLRGAAAIIFVLILSMTLSSSFAHGCSASECEALISFKKNYKDPNGLLSSWRGEDCCGWKGVRCNNQTGHIIKLDLHGPEDFMEAENNLRGQIIMNSSIIAALPHLRYLDLSFNYFSYSTSEPLSFLGALNNLRYLNLSNAGFSGSIPGQLGNLSRLQHLDLSSIDLQYASDLTWLPHLSSLKTLYMSGWNLSCASDWVSKVNMLPDLKTLDLSWCSLSSETSRLSHSNVTHLEILDLSNNAFINSFLQHSWFWDVTSIRELYLSSCGWSGLIPGALGNMSSLEVLYIDGNSISGMVPTALEKLCSLHLLNLEYNIISADIIGRLPQCSWSKLRELHLHGANLTGQLPAWIGNLTSLTFLDLSSNMLIGSIPSGIENMRSLSYLDLSMNMLVGSIPSGIVNMRSLSYLELSTNMLVGYVPFGIGNMRSLSYLDLSHNMLDGSIPSGIGNMRSLSHLDLSCNMLHGDVPSGIGTLSNLTDLILSSNNFSSVLSKEHFASLMNLEYLEIENTSLKLDFGEDWVPPFKLIYAIFGSCDMGPQFPTWLRWQTSIDVLDISNTKINDVLPHWFWVAFPNASMLKLSGNKLSGTLPPNLELPLVEIIYLSGNSLSGQLPANLTAPHLSSLDLCNNHFTGTIPPYLCNGFSEINLSNNQLTGGFPHCQSNESSFYLSMLDLRNNNLSGEFPRFLQYAPNLILLDLSYNRFSGSVPIWVAEKMPSLEVLILRSNMFCGHLPRQLSRIVGLHYLDVAQNNISGIIPSSLARLRAMADPHETDDDHLPDSFGIHNRDIISAFIKNRELNYTHEFTKHTVLIDLSSNGFIGQIPKEFTLLKGLRSLNLSNNQLSGPIPDDVGSLRKLESLDLSYNYFSGNIPSSLSDLTFLSCLNLSYNHLSGTIPSGQQLQTLNDRYMYIGNPGLCGPPLLRNCSMNVTNPRSKNVTNPTVSQQHEGGKSSFYISMSMGFIMGLWIVFCTMLFMKTWRIAYFQLLDQLYDKLHVQLAINKAAILRKFGSKEI